MGVARRPFLDDELGLPGLSLRLGTSIGISHLAGIVLGVIAWFWIAILTDQMPCFLGVPNCD
jgi:hypothetical protein